MAWILQSMKRLGDYYFLENTREDQNLVKTIIERHGEEYLQKTS